MGLSTGTAAKGLSSWAKAFSSLSSGFPNSKMIMWIPRFPQDLNEDQGLFIKYVSNQKLINIKSDQWYILTKHLLNKIVTATTD